jgi:IclR family acetate operon transcriptional repressor
MPALTEYTFTDPRKLSQEIMRICARGYSIDNQEVIIGVYCVAVPILNGAGHAVGAMSITGTSPKQPGPKIHPWLIF